MKLFLVAALVALTQAQVYGNSDADMVSTAGWDLMNYTYKSQTYQGLYCKSTDDCRQKDWYDSVTINYPVSPGVVYVHNATTTGAFSGMIPTEGFDRNDDPATLESFRDGSFCDIPTGSSIGICKICPYTTCSNMPDTYLDGPLVTCVRECTRDIGLSLAGEEVTSTVTCQVSNQDATCGPNHSLRDLLYDYLAPQLAGVPGNPFGITPPPSDFNAGRGGFFCGQNTQPTESLPDPLGRCLSCATINSNPHLGVITPGEFTSLDDFNVTVDAEGAFKQCVNYPYFGLNNVANRIQCRLRCELIEFYTAPEINLDAVLEAEGRAQPWRFSYMESLCSAADGESGCCNTFGQEECEDPLFTGNPSVTNYHFEHSQCGFRECVADAQGNDYCFVFSYTSRAELLASDWKDNDTDGEECTRFVNAGDGEIFEAAGVCSDGTCIVYKDTSDGDEGHDCPNGYEYYGDRPFGTCQSVRKDYVIISMGGDNDFSHPETNSQDQCQTDGGVCDTIGPGKDLLCFSYAVNGPKTDGTEEEREQSQHVNASLFMNYFDPGQTFFTNETDIRETVRTVNADGLNAIPDEVHTRIVQNLTQMGQTSGNYGDCWIAEPGSPKAGDCLITEAGIYLYKHHRITWAVAYHGPEENPTERITVLAMPDLLRPMVGVLSCGNQPFNTCRGQMTCDYTTTSEGDHPCHGNYTTCRNVTASPTMYPTREPTSPPVTAHGDPIIWTFEDDCYDLNKDGMYTASKHPSHDHDVQIGVYNDFMRNIQVVRDGEVILDINNFGEVVGAETYPYSFTSEVKKCPEDMKKTECNGSYTQHEFDAQNFRYIVQSGLRHDYADEALSEGELGYHLDIYPRPYTNFDEARAGYSGLFFENPLPEELPYCPGGSARRQ